MNIPASTTTQTTQPAPETVYYGDGSVWITDRRIIFNGQEHPLYPRLRTLLQVHRARDRVRLLLFVSSLAIVALLAITLLFSTPAFLGLDLFPFNFLRMTCSFLFGLLLLATLAFLIYIPFLVRRIANQADIYTLSFGVRFPSTLIAASTDRMYIQNIFNTLQYAIDLKSDKLPTAPPLTNPPAPPRPIIDNGMLHVGAATFELQNANKVRVGRIQDLKLQAFLVMVLSFQCAGMLLRQITGDFGWLYALLTTFSTVGWISYFVVLILSSRNSIHAVVLANPTTDTIAYATTNHDEAKRLKKALDSTIKQLKSTPSISLPTP